MIHDPAELGRLRWKKVGKRRRKKAMQDLARQLWAQLTPEERTERQRAAAHKGHETRMKRIQARRLAEKRTESK